jgi:hypothetical protein
MAQVIYNHIEKKKILGDMNLNTILNSFVVAFDHKK